MVASLMASSERRAVKAVPVLVALHPLRRRVARRMIEWWLHNRRR
jgi:hypothetical protein